MTIKIEREKAIKIVREAISDECLMSNSFVKALAALGLIEFVEPVSVEERARRVVCDCWGMSTDDLMQRFKEAGIAFAEVRS